jgi:AcrR family transcriptional regulator
MPVSVDREERRALVVTVASRLIAEAGLDAVTVRDVAEAAQCSTAIVSHYFHNKRELLFLTYNSSIERCTARSQPAMAAGDLRGVVVELMPLDEERLIEWKIWLAFWAKAVADPEIAEIQRRCVMQARGNILHVLEKLAARGALTSGVDLEDEARRILTAIMGLAIQVMFDPDDWPAARQLALIDRDLARLYRPGHVPAELRLREPA